MVIAVLSAYILRVMLVESIGLIVSNSNDLRSNHGAGFLLCIVTSTSCGTASFTSTHYKLCNDVVVGRTVMAFLTQAVGVQVQLASVFTLPSV